MIGWTFGNQIPYGLKNPQLGQSYRVEGDIDYGGRGLHVYRQPTQAMVYGYHGLTAHRLHITGQVVYPDKRFLSFACKGTSRVCVSEITVVGVLDDVTPVLRRLGQWLGMRDNPAWTRADFMYEALALVRDRAGYRFHPEWLKIEDVFSKYLWEEMQARGSAYTGADISDAQVHPDGPDASAVETRFGA